MSHEVFVHYLHGGRYDGDHIPNHRPWESVTLTDYCEAHKNVYVDMEVMANCPNCKHYKYNKIEPTEYKEADSPGIEVITPDGVDQSPILHRIEMNYEGK